jgi:hypothetical protein
MVAFGCEFRAYGRIAPHTQGHVADQLFRARGEFDGRAHGAAELEEVFVRDDRLFARREVQEGNEGADAAGYWGRWVVGQRAVEEEWW